MNLKDLQIIVIPTETQDVINPDSSYEEIVSYEDAVMYDLGRYFEDQNSEDIGLHWSFLVNVKTKEILNGKYNSELY